MRFARELETDRDNVCIRPALRSSLRAWSSENLLLSTPYAPSGMESTPIRPPSLRKGLGTTLLHAASKVMPGPNDSYEVNVPVIKLADLGESRISVDQTMTMVGTPGYTSPEILKGRRYGAASDVYSLAMVICEVMQWQQNWKSQQAAGLSWSQLNHSIGSKKIQLRPDIATYRNDTEEENTALVNLVKSMWAHEEKERPTMPSVLFRLRAIRDGETRVTGSSLNQTSVGALAYRKIRKSRRRRERASSQTNLGSDKAIVRSLLSLVPLREHPTEVAKELRDLMISYTRHGLIDDERLENFVEKDIQGSFEDPTMTEVFLGKTSGLPFIKGFLRLLVDEKHRYKYTFEFDEFVVEEHFASAAGREFYCRVKYNLIRKKKEIHQSDTGAMASIKIDLNLNADDGISFRSRRPKSKENKLKWRFMRAAHFGRLHALKVTSPSILLKCYGVYKQAVYGDYSDKSMASLKEHRDKRKKLSLAQSLISTLDPLKKQKLEAWKRESGKTKEEAMREYIGIISDNFPGWEFSAAMESMADSGHKRPTEIIWAFKCTLNEELSRLSALHLLRFDTETRGIDWFGARNENGSQTSSETDSQEAGNSSTSSSTAAYALRNCEVFEVPSAFILDQEHCNTLDEAMTKHTNEALAVADASDWV